MKTKITMQQLVAEVKRQPKNPPQPGFKTIDEWVKEMPEFSHLTPGRASQAVASIMHKLVSNGKVEVKKFTAQCGGVVRTINHYRVV